MIVCSGIDRRKPIRLYPQDWYWEGRLMWFTCLPLFAVHYFCLFWFSIEAYWKDDLHLGLEKLAVRIIHTWSRSQFSSTYPLVGQFFLGYLIYLLVSRLHSSMRNCESLSVCVNARVRAAGDMTHDGQQRRRRTYFTDCHCTQTRFHLEFWYFFSTNHQYRDQIWLRHGCTVCMYLTWQSIF